MKTPAHWYRPAGPLATLLTPVGHLYGAATALRLALGRPVAVGVPVICVGNLVAGGAGKTPVALALLDRLQRAGRSPHALTRGYRGRLTGPVPVDPARHDAAAVGDEALLLAARAPTWIGADRAAAAQAAVAAGADCLVMDDGFQNPALTPTLALIVVDGAVGFGNRKLIPAGPLRETLTAGLARADAVVVVGADRGGVAAAVAGRRPILAATLAPEPTAAAALAGQRVAAFAGIGRPEKFFATLAGVGSHLVFSRSFPDHHPYRPEEIMALVEAAQGLAAVPVTTAKDAVRLPPGAHAMVRVLPVELAWQDAQAIDALLDPVFAGRSDRVGRSE